MTFSSSNDAYFESLTQSKNCLNIVINTDFEVLHSNLNSGSHTSIKGMSIVALLGDAESPMSTSLLKIIKAVFKSGQAKNLPIQQGIIPFYNLLSNYWQINLYPLVDKETILIQMVDISPLINLESAQYHNNFLEANSNKRKVSELLVENKNLKIKEQKLQLLIENIKDYAIFLLDTEGYITTWNYGAETINQYKSNEIIGQHFSILYTDEAKQRNHPQQELELAKKNGRYEEEGWRVKKDGSLIWANVIITPIYDQDILVGFGKVTRDLSERKKVEDLKNQFISVVSHELRTPLTSISGSLSLILRNERIELSENNTHLLKIANKNCQRLTRLINDVLDIEKLQEGHLIFHFKFLNLQTLIQEAIRLNEFISSKYNVRVVYNFLEDTYVYADEDRLLQVLINLLSNAVKFSYEGTTVKVIIRKNKKFVAVFIQNQGEGIPKQFKKQVFERFFQVDSTNARKKDGTGLGLAISKEIIKQHKGVINYYSIVHKKTTFYFKIPIVNTLSHNK